MDKKSKRQQARERERKRKITSRLLWVGIGIVIVAVIGTVAWRSIRPAVGEAVPIMVSAPHAPKDTDPGEYNSNPPTSGLHYAEEAQAGFYDSDIYTYPAGYLVHNLEHGYIIFWYNCEVLPENECSELKTQIQSVMDDLGGVKMIAYPWTSIDVPVVMTSWGRLQRMETFDPQQAKAFYRANLNRAPEPNAP